MNSHDSQLARLAAPETLRELGAAGLGWSPRDAHACSALRFLREVKDAPAIVGLVGGASSGKSTIFNALIGREVSAISAHAHETLGPIAAGAADLIVRVQEWMAADLLFRNHQPVPFSDATPTAGSVDAVLLSAHSTPELAGTILCDLPDVTSRSAADEGALTRNLLPYFDGLIVVVDEERWFDAAVFEEFLGQARAFGPRVFVVFNRTEQAGELSAEDRARIAAVAEQHRADGHCISAFQPGSGYRPVSPETRRALLDWLGGKARSDRAKSVAAYLAQRASAVIAENVTRAERYDGLQRSVHDELAQIARDTSLTLDLLTAEERGLLGLGHRFVPLYDLARQVGRRLGGLMGRKATGEVDFEKRQDALAAVLGRNLEVRFGRATARIDELVAANAYLPAGAGWENQWSPPPIDAGEWARRIRAHIDAWRDEAKAQSRHGDIAAVSLGTPLLVADLLFLGGAGMTVTWVAASVAAFLGGKGISRLVQRSPAYAAYQTTVRAYQSLLRESLAEQWEANRQRLPRRHLKMTDPILTALMHVSTPGRA